MTQRTTHKTIRNKENIPYLTQQQSRLLLESIDNPKHKLMVLLMLRVGLRVSEMLAVEVQHIDFKNRMISVASLKKREKGNTRNIPLADDVYSELVQFCAERKLKSGIALFTYQGKAISRFSVYKMLRRLSSRNPELLPLELHPHKLRHTFATQLRSQNAKLEDIKDALGHSSINTSLIYAHQEPEELRKLLNKTEGGWKPTLRKAKNFVKKQVFGIRQKSYNFQELEAEQSPFVGRQKEVQKLTELLNKGISILITGKAGVGKSSLLEVVCTHRKTLIFDDVKSFKKDIATTILYLLKGDKEQMKELLYGETTEAQLKTKISRESLPSLCKLLCELTEKKEYILQISDLDQLTPTVVKALEQLAAHFVIAGTARSIPMSKATFLWSFERLDLGCLNRAESLKLIHRLTTRLDFEDYAQVRNRLYDATRGNPRMLSDLCERFHKETDLSREVVDEIVQNYLGKESEQIDMSLYFLLFFGGLAVLRYLSVETGETSFRFIGGVFMIVLLFARFFFTRMQRKVL